MTEKKLSTKGVGAMAATIHLIREQRVILDVDLAALYGVSTKVFNQAMKRNRARLLPR